jgi:hypothetical protein
MITGETTSKTGQKCQRKRRKTQGWERSKEEKKKWGKSDSEKL